MATPKKTAAAAKKPEVRQPIAIGTVISDDNRRAISQSIEAGEMDNYLLVSRSIIQTVDKIMNLDHSKPFVCLDSFYRSTSYRVIEGSETGSVVRDMRNGKPNAYNGWAILSAPQAHAIAEQLRVQKTGYLALHKDENAMSMSELIDIFDQPHKSCEEQKTKQAQEGVAAAEKAKAAAHAQMHSNISGAICLSAGLATLLWTAYDQGLYVENKEGLKTERTRTGQQKTVFLKNVGELLQIFEEIAPVDRALKNANPYMNRDNAEKELKTLQQKLIDSPQAQNPLLRNLTESLAKDPLVDKRVKPLVGILESYYGLVDAHAKNDTAREQHYLNKLRERCGAYFPAEKKLSSRTFPLGVEIAGIAEDKGGKPVVGSFTGKEGEKLGVVGFGDWSRV